MGISKYSVEMLSMDGQPGKSRHLAPAESLLWEVRLPFAGRVLRGGISISQSKGAGGKREQPGCRQSRFPSFLEPRGFPYCAMKRNFCSPCCSADSCSLGAINSTVTTGRIADPL